MAWILRQFWFWAALRFRCGAGCATREHERCRHSRWTSCPLILLFAISITGLALTVSQEWLGGSFYDFIAILHAITVIAALLYLPFGKFFHIFQRPAQLGVKLYQRAGDEGEGAACARCGERYRVPDAR